MSLWNNNEQLVDQAYKKAVDGYPSLNSEEYYAVMECAKGYYGNAVMKKACDVCATIVNNSELVKDIYYGRDTYAEKRYAALGNDLHVSSGCFITTACMEFMSDSFDDECYELTTLREFRDSYLAENHPDLVREYYEIAPAIVEAINAQENRAEIYNDIYFNMVLPSIDAYLSGQYETAMKIYRDYTFKLKGMFVDIEAEA